MFIFKFVLLNIKTLSLFSRSAEFISMSPAYLFQKFWVSLGSISVPELSEPSPSDFPLQAFLPHVLLISHVAGI